MSLQFTMEDHMMPYAARSAESRGRHYPESEHPFRSIYQRDRDRVIHCAAFRRLEYKTQVFVNHEGDHYRTRLTHTMEVSQISRTMARALGLNEDLTEAVALAHDLGHTPFGHSGEDELDALMRDHGGFEHNMQGLRVVDLLETRYAGFPGLNLSYEVREAFLRHHTPWDHPEESQDGFFLSERPLIEVQLTVLADEIAYDNHDIDDGLFSGVLLESDLEELALWRKAMEMVGSGYRDLPVHLRRSEGVRRLINLLATDAIETTCARIRDCQIKTLEDVRSCKTPLVGLSEEVDSMKTELERFLYTNFYKHYRVMRMANKAQRFLRELFEAYVEDPRTLPTGWQERAKTDDLHRVVCDYIAGMTDRCAEDEYRKLFHPFERT